MRAIILKNLYQWSLIPYQSLKRRVAWGIDTHTLLGYPTGTLGHALGIFLKAHHFTLQRKLESHDVFHVLTNTGASVPEEIGMQFYLFGNGKRSMYLFSVLLSGTLLYPDRLPYLYKQWKRGKNALQFHQLDFYKLLDQPLERIKSTFLIQ
ncbi:MAG: Coq4 family protein [Bacteroidota bacterium]